MERKKVDRIFENMPEIIVTMQDQMSRGYATRKDGRSPKEKGKGTFVHVRGVAFPGVPPLSQVIKRPSEIRDGQLHIDNGNGLVYIMPAHSEDSIVKYAEKGIFESIRASGCNPEDIGRSWNNQDFRGLEQKLFTSGFVHAFRQAESFSRQGYVASLPQILALRAQDTSKRHSWSPYIVANSEEIAAYARNGPRAGSLVVIDIHGGGIITSSRLEDQDIFNSTKDCGIGISQRYIDALLERGKNNLLGTLPNGDKIPVFDYYEFLEESGKKDFLVKTPRFAVIRDMGYACLIPSETIESTPYANSTYLVRAGGVETTLDYHGAACAMDYKVRIENLVPQISVKNGMGVGFILCVKDNGNSSIETYKITSNEAPFLGLRYIHKKH